MSVRNPLGQWCGGRQPYEILVTVTFMLPKFNFSGRDLKVKYENSEQGPPSEDVAFFWLEKVNILKWLIWYVLN